MSEKSVSGRKSNPVSLEYKCIASLPTMVQLFADLWHKRDWFVWDLWLTEC